MNRSIVRIEQDVAVTSGEIVRAGVDRAIEGEPLMPRHFDVAAVAALGSALCGDAAVVPRIPIRPHHHLAAVAARQRIGCDRGARPHINLLGVGEGVV